MENLNLVNTKYAIEMLRKHGVSNGGTLGFHAGWCDIAADQLESALSLIKSQAEQIFALENRLKECENGYEETLYLERCKLHDAEEKVEKLTADYDGLNKGVNELLIIGASTFAERVKKLFDGFDTVQSEIDGVLNEMKGEILC